MIKNIPHKYIIGIALLLYVILQSYCIQLLSPNYDEGSFAAYGASILKREGNKDIVRFDSKLPITALNMIPRAVEQIIHPGLTKNSEVSDIISGRYVSLLAAILLSLVIYYWSDKLYGKNAGLFSFFIYLISPNFLAHGIFVSSDIFACLFMTLCLLYLWKYCREKKTKDFVLMSLFTSMALISKFSMVHLLLIIPALLILNFLFLKNGAEHRRFLTRKGFLLFLSFLFINWFVISAAHLFYGMFLPLNDYHFMSSTFAGIQSLFHFAGNYLFIPLPSSYISSMDAVMYFDHIGGGVPGSLNGPPYILGNNSVHGFWYYYFVVLFYKLPIPVLILIVLLLFVAFKKGFISSFRKNEMFLLIPAIYFLIYMNFFYSTQVGIRHIMIIFPLLYISFGSIFRYLMPRVSGYLLPLLVVFQMVSVSFYFPHFLPYTNELIPDRKLAYKKIADTNICYGEGAVYLKKYLEKNKDVAYLPDKPTAGKVVMEVNEMLDLNIQTMGKYDWARNLTPVDAIQSQYLVFNVSKEQADSLLKIHP